MATRLFVDRTATARITMRCWGDFAIHDAVSGADLKPRGRKARALLAYLAQHPDKTVSRERLMGLLWGERADEQARASVRQALFELRDFTRGPRPLLRVDRESVTICGAAIETDIEAMRRWAGAWDYESLLSALPDADEVLFANLDDVDPAFDDWLRTERARQCDALRALVADASASALATGRTRAARDLHKRLLEFGPDEDRGAPGDGPAISAPPLTPVAAAEPIARRSLIGGGALLLASAAVGGTLWLRPGQTSSAEAPSREVRGLYETARGIIYRRKRAEYPIAISLLRRALVLEPDYPPALASLASVTAMSSRTPAALAEAESLARRAIALDPALAHAHGTLGMVLGFDPVEARTAIKRAAALDPRDPEVQFWLCQILAIEGDYVGRLQALRRAVATDPLWPRATGFAALAAWELGYREEADGHVARLRELDLQRSFDCAYAIDWARGDYSDVVRDTRAVRERLTEANAADWKLGLALLVLGHEQAARLLLRLPPPLWRVASDAGPAAGELTPLLILAEDDERASFLMLTGLRQVLRDGRVEEIAAAYDNRVGRLGGLASGTAPNATMILEGAQVAIALRTIGREREAADLLMRADAAVRYSLSKGAMPNWMYAAAAGVWAAQGRRDEALAALRIAIDRGWHYSPMTPLPDMAAIPSFASLRGDARFEQLRWRLKDHLQHERRKLGPVPV